MLNIFAIAAGGALGTLGRYCLANFVAGATGANFPWGIFLINVIGSFVMGVMVGLFAYMWQPSQTVRSFITIGILGGFTTFSTFSLDAVSLLQRDATGAAALYVFGSVGCGMAALYGGLLLVRTLAA